MIQLVPGDSPTVLATRPDQLAVGQEQVHDGLAWALVSDHQHVADDGDIPRRKATQRDDTRPLGRALPLWDGSEDALRKTN